ncbi:MAG: hypothetical protein K0R59_663 [Sphingobacterium sp.]|jgi:hypothetical protein|nr:hypothetical protein [Sphingobacterium sp.]
MGTLKYTIGLGPIVLFITELNFTPLIVPSNKVFLNHLCRSGNN